MADAFVPPVGEPNFNAADEDVADEWDSEAEGDSRPEPARKGIRPQSAKSKGRRLQQWAAIQFKEAFPHLQGNDVRSLSMGASGDDLILSPAALQVLPYNFEMKNVEKFQLWATLRQVEKRRDTDTTWPCLVVKRNHINPVAMVPLGHFLHLLRFECTPVRQDGVLPPPPVREMVSAEELLTAFHLRGATPTQCLHMALCAGLGFALRNPQAVSEPQPGVLNVSEHWAVHVQASARFNFWNEWDELVLRYKPRKKNTAPPTHPLMAFNRGDVQASVFVALPFAAFLSLLRARWTHVRKNQIVRLMAE